MCERECAITETIFPASMLRPLPRFLFIRHGQCLEWGRGKRNNLEAGCGFLDWMKLSIDAGLLVRVTLWRRPNLEKWLSRIQVLF